MEDVRVCVDCGAKAPATNSEFTLISVRYGWRVIRTAPRPGGGGGIEWRCPFCWRAYKKQANLGDSSEETVTAPSSRRPR